MSQITEYVADETVHKHPFTIIYNELIDSNLPLEVIGLIAYMCRQIPGWVFHEHKLLERLQCGREKLQKMRRLAREAGFMKLDKIPSGKGDGKFKGSRYSFSSRPIFLNRETEKPTPGENRLPVEPALFNKTKNLNKTISLNKENKDHPMDDPVLISLFDEFWAEYPRKIAKGRARTAYKLAMKKVDHVIIMDGIRKQKVWRSSLGPKNFVPDWKHPATWLNGECWADELDVPAKNGTLADEVKAYVNTAPRMHKTEEETKRELERRMPAPEEIAPPERAMSAIAQMKGCLQGKFKSTMEKGNVRNNSRGVVPTSEQGNRFSGEDLVATGCA